MKSKISRPSCQQFKYVIQGLPGNCISEVSYDMHRSAKLAFAIWPDLIKVMVKQKTMDGTFGEHVPKCQRFV